MDSLKVEAEAALAAVHLAAGRPDDAWPLLETAVGYLLANPQPDCEALGQLYLDCITLLQARGDDERAGLLLQQAVETLRRQAAGIADAAAQSAFVDEVAAHHRLLTLHTRATTANEQ